MNIIQWLYQIISVSDFNMILKELAEQSQGVIIINNLLAKYNKLLCSRDEPITLKNLPFFFQEFLKSFTDNVTYYSCCLCHVGDYV